MSSSGSVKEEQARQAKATRKVKVKCKGKKGESNKDEEDKDNDKKGKSKGKNNAKAEYFAGYCLQCRGWKHMKKGCWWNENVKSEKDTASLETPITPAESTRTEPPITVTKQESVPNAKDFVFDSGAVTSVCQQSLADSLGGKSRRPGVALSSATGHRSRRLATRDGVNVASEFQVAPKNTGLQKVDHLGGTSV